MAAYTNTVMLADTSDVAGFLGAGADAGFTVTMQDLVGVYAEAYICNLIKYDAVTNWASLNAVYKLMMSEYVARQIAIEGIKYNMKSTYTSRVEAEGMVRINWARCLQIEEKLKASDIQDFQGV